MEEDTEDLSTCCVCLEPYDKEERKPKFLSCGHTLCLKCVKVNKIFLFMRASKWY